MKKKLKIIIPIAVLLIICIITIAFLYLNKENNIETSYKIYRCTNISEYNTFRVSDVEYIYEVIVDNNENTLHFKSTIKYYHDTLSQYYTNLYNLRLIENINLSTDEDNLVITVIGYDNVIYNDDGEVINPNYLEYINQYINEDYECSFVE